MQLKAHRAQIPLGEQSAVFTSLLHMLTAGRCVSVCVWVYVCVCDTAVINKGCNTPITD